MVAIHTPIDLPLDDLQDHQLDRCLLTTSSLTDVGIVGVAGAWQRSGEADEAEQDSALQLDPAEAAALEQLGLPTAFGSSKDTTASKPQRKKSSQTPKVEQAALQLPDVFEAEEPAQQRFEKAATAAGLSGATATPSTSEWEQGYDYETGYYYYYRVSTNETQWETPAEGFRPLCFPGMEAGTVDTSSAGNLAATDMGDTPDQAQQSGMPSPEGLESVTHAQQEPAAAQQEGTCMRSHEMLTSAAAEQQPGEPATAVQQTPVAWQSQHAKETSPGVPASAVCRQQPQAGQAATAASPTLEATAMDAQQPTAAQHAQQAAAPQLESNTSQAGNANDLLHGKHSQQGPTKRSLFSRIFGGRADPGTSKVASTRRAKSPAEPMTHVEQAPVPVHTTAATGAASGGAGQLVEAQAEAALADPDLGIIDLDQAAQASPAVAQQLEAIAADALQHTVDLGPSPHGEAMAKAADAVQHKSQPSAEANPCVTDRVTAKPGGAGAAEQSGLQLAASAVAEDASGGNANSLAGASKEMAGLAEDVQPLDQHVATTAAACLGGSTQAQRQKQKRERKRLAVPAGAAARQQVPRKVFKYWLQRYSLFSRFDEGIQMDQEGWFSVTPEVMAAACAARCAGAVVVDAFAGVGGNTIQFAAACRHVIAVDVCQARLELAQHNAGVYGVVQKADFVCADFFRIAPSLKADIVFLSPPWGGPSYGDSSVFDITGDPFGLGVTLKELTDVSWKALHPNSKARGLICFLPRNTNLQQLCEVVPEGMYCEVERNLLNGYLKATTVYIGNCFRRE